MFKNHFFAKISMIMLIAPVPLFAGQGRVSSSGDTIQVVSMHPKWKTAEIIEGSFSTANQNSFEEKAVEFLILKKNLIRIYSPASELKHISTKTDNINFTHVRFQQQFNDILIWGCETIVHFDEEDKIYLLGGQTIATPEISTIPSSSSSLAEQSVLDELGKRLNVGYTFKETELIIYPDDDIPRLCWQVVIEDFESIPARWRCFVDASTLEILLIYNDLPSDGPAVGVGNDVLGVERSFGTYEFGGTYKMVDASLPMYTAPVENFQGVINTHLGTFSATNPFANFGPGNTWNYHWLEEACVSSQYNISLAYYYFYNTFGRDSWDDNNASVHGIAYASGIGNNAYWLGNGQIAFGSGDSVRYLPWSGADDMVAHEFAHGVTQTTANLTYLFQSGALNESYSDFFGVMVDRDDWTIAEDISLFATGFLRSMEDPHQGAIPDYYAFGYQPAHMSEYVEISALNDNGGVHSNSGIPNRVAYLVGSVIGKDKTEQIWYRTLTTYLTPGSSFHFWGQMTGQSIIDLYGYGTELDALSAALDSVGIYQPFVIPDPLTFSVKFGTIESEELIVYSGLTDTVIIDSVKIANGLVSVNDIFPVSIMNGEGLSLQVLFDASSYIACDMGNYYDTLEIYNSSIYNPQIAVPVDISITGDREGGRGGNIYESCDPPSRNRIDNRARVHNTGAISELNRSGEDGLYRSTLLVGLIDGIDTTVYMDIYDAKSFLPESGFRDSFNVRTRYSTRYCDIFADQSKVVGTVEFFYKYYFNEHCGEIIAEYNLTNICDTTLEIVVGIFADFDVNGADFVSNLAGLDVENNIGFVSNTSNSRAIGIKPMGATPRNMRLVNNQADIWPTGNLEPGFAYREMMETTNKTGTGAFDWSILLTFETATLAPGDTLQYAAAFIHSDIGLSDLIDMFDNIGTYKDSAVLFPDTNNIAVTQRIGQLVSDTTIFINYSTIGEEPSVSWEASHDSSWLSLSDYSGMTDQEITISFDITGMEQGIYFDSIMFTSPSAINTPVYTKIELLLHPEGNIISVPLTNLQRIKDGLKLAIDGDTIMVGPGDYHEYMIIEDKSIFIKSTEGPSKTTLFQVTQYLGRTIEIRECYDKRVEISGFTLTNLGNGNGSGWILYVRETNYDSIYIYDNIILEAGWGFYLRARMIHVYNNIFIGGSKFSAIWVQSSGASADIRNNIFYNNKASVATLNGGSAYLRGNIIVNSESYGLYGDNIDSDCNIIWGNGPDYMEGATPGQNHIFADPHFCYPGALNFNVDASSPVLAANNACNLLIGLPDIVEEDCGVGCVLRGDMDHDGNLNIVDLVYLVSYMFKSGPAPISFEEGDINLSGETNIADLTFIVSFFFKSGPAPLPCSK